MEIEQFILKSLGEWNSMRSGHSLAFKHFEDIRSKITISRLKKGDKDIADLIIKNGISLKKIGIPFSIRWEAESDWEINKDISYSSGESLLIPIPISKAEGELIRSEGYAEKIRATSKYKFLSDGTLTLSTQYKETIAEERIWFVSNNVRCRTSVIRASKSLAILQTSYASEVRKINI